LIVHYSSWPPSDTLSRTYLTSQKRAAEVRVMGQRFPCRGFAQGAAGKSTAQPDLQSGIRPKPSLKQERLNYPRPQCQLRVREPVQHRHRYVWNLQCRKKIDQTDADDPPRSRPRAKPIQQARQGLYTPPPPPPPGNPRICSWLTGQFPRPVTESCRSGPHRPQPRGHSHRVALRSAPPAGRKSHGDGD